MGHTYSDTKLFISEPHSSPIFNLVKVLSIGLCSCQIEYREEFDTLLTYLIEAVVEIDRLGSIIYIATGINVLQSLMTLFIVLIVVRTHKGKLSSVIL